MITLRVASHPLNATSTAPPPSDSTPGVSSSSAVTALVTMAKPVIAKVQGVAAGAGASLTFACDFRILSDKAAYNMAFTGVALSCDTGISWTLPRLIGKAKALELLYFPSTLSAERATAPSATASARPRRR